MAITNLKADLIKKAMWGSTIGTGIFLATNIATKIKEYSKLVAIRGAVINQTKFGHGTGSPYDLYK